METRKSTYSIEKKVVSFFVVFAFIMLQSNSCLYALPQGYEVVSGDVQFEQVDPSTLHITASDQAIINFSSFNIGNGETVQFFQPGSSSSVLGRITGSEASTILGNLFANGQLFLVNPYGMSFGPTANVQVGSLLASTLDISNQDFLDRNYIFNKNPNVAAGMIVNEGMIRTTGPDGFIALMSPGVKNMGSITAQLGTVALVSGDKITMSFDQDGLISFAINDPTQMVPVSTDASVHNLGEILADGGVVLIAAKSAVGVIDEVINNEGIIQAKSMVEREGKVFLVGGSDYGLVANRGTIDVSAQEAGVDGGSVQMTGYYVGHAGTIKANAMDNAAAGSVDLRSTHLTKVTSNSLIQANGSGENSDGGHVVLWSDEYMQFPMGARLEAKGGDVSGDGGFVETSGLLGVSVAGSVDTSAPNGEMGMYLIDPINVTIADGADGSGANDNQLDVTDGTIAGSDDSGSSYTISEGALEAVQASTNISITATGTITVNDLSDNVLTLDQTGSVAFSSAIFVMNGTNDTINVTGGGSLTITASGGSITVSGLTTSNAAISLQATTSITLNGAVASGGGSVTMYADSNDSGSDGNFTMNSGSSITSGGGAITIASGMASGSGTKLGTYTLRDISSSGGSGNISIRTGISAAGSITQAGNITTGTGYYATTWGTGGYTMNSGTSITSGGGINMGSDAQGTMSGNVSLQTLSSSGSFTCCGGSASYSILVATSGSLSLNNTITSTAAYGASNLGVGLEGDTALTQGTSASISVSNNLPLYLMTNTALALTAPLSSGNMQLVFDHNGSGAENFSTTSAATINSGTGYLLIYQGGGVNGGGNITMNGAVTVGTATIGNPSDASLYAFTNGTITASGAINSGGAVYLSADMDGNGSGTQLTVGDITTSNDGINLGSGSQGSGLTGSIVQNGNLNSGSGAINAYFGESYTQALGTSITTSGGLGLALQNGTPTGDITLRNLNVSGAMTCCGGSTVTMAAQTSGAITLDGTISGPGAVSLAAGTNLTDNATITTTGSGSVALTVSGGSIAQNGNITAGSGGFQSGFTGSYTMANGTSVTSTGGVAFGLQQGGAPSGNITLKTVNSTGTFSCCGGGTYAGYLAASGNITADTLNISGAGNVSLTAGGNISLTAGDLSATNSTLSISGDSDGNGVGTLSLGSGDLTGDFVTILSGDLFGSGNGGTNLTINNDITVTGNATLNDGMPAGLIATGAGSSITLGGSITLSDTGDMAIQAGTDIIMSSGASIAGSGGDFYFAFNGDGNGNSGAFTMGSSSSVNAGSGGVTIESANLFGGSPVTGGGDVTLASLTAGTFDIETLGGAILDGNGSSTNLTGTSTTLVSGTGIGSSGNSLEVAFATLTSASVTGTGGIFLSDTGGLTVTSAVTASGDITISTSSGNLTATTITAGGSGSDITLSTTTSGDVNVGNVTASGDTITITSAGKIEESGSDGGADLTATTISLNAATGIGSSGTLETASNNMSISKSGSSGSIAIDNTGNLNITSFTSGGGSISLTTHSDLTIASAIDTNGGAITLNAADGNIYQNANVTTDGGLVTYTAFGDITMGLVSLTTSGANVSMTAGTGGSGDATITGIDVSGANATVTINATNGEIIDAGQSPISVLGINPDIWTGSEASQATNLYLASSGFTSGTSTPFGEAPGENVQGKVVSGIGSDTNPLSIFSALLSHGSCLDCEQESNGPTEKLAVLKDKQCLDIQESSYVDMTHLAGQRYVTVKPGYYLLAKRNEVLQAPMKGNLDKIVEMYSQSPATSKMPAPSAKECVCCSENSQMQLAKNK